MTAADHHDHARRITEQGTRLDYEQEALAGLARSWTNENPECQRLALMDAQVWATLHHARQTGRHRLAAHSDSRRLTTPQSADQGPVVAAAPTPADPDGSQTLTGGWDSGPGPAPSTQEDA